jgi:hypothetical protein
MGEHKMGERVEQRAHERFEAQPGVLAVLGPNSRKMGQVLDISKGGLAFNYKNGIKEPEEVYELSILLDDSNGLNHRPFKFNAAVVSDKKVANDVQFSNATIRRCGVQFLDLTYYQQTWLDECIRNHTFR